MKKIYNQDKTQELNLNDLNEELGILKSDVLITHIEEVKAVEEQGHYETIAEYPNGGKDVKWVIDVHAVQAKPAEDIKEDIYVYIPYTEEELQQRRTKKRIDELKAFLYDTDYKAIKYAEGELTEEEYTETRDLRRAYRAEINKLEKLLQ